MLVVGRVRGSDLMRALSLLVLIALPGLARVQTEYFPVHSDGTRFAQRQVEDTAGA